MAKKLCNISFEKHLKKKRLKRSSVYIGLQTGAKSWFQNDIKTRVETAPLVKRMLEKVIDKHLYRMESMIGKNLIPSVTRSTLL